MLSMHPPNLVRGFFTCQKESYSTEQVARPVSRLSKIPSLLTARWQTLGLEESAFIFVAAT